MFCLQGILSKNQNLVCLKNQKQRMHKNCKTCHFSFNLKVPEVVKKKKKMGVRCRQFRIKISYWRRTWAEVWGPTSQATEQVFKRTQSSTLKSKVMFAKPFSKIYFFSLDRAYDAESHQLSRGVYTLH